MWLNQGRGFVKRGVASHPFRGMIGSSMWAWLKEVGFVGKGAWFCQKGAWLTRTAPAPRLAPATKPQPHLGEKRAWPGEEWAWPEVGGLRGGVASPGSRVTWRGAESAQVTSRWVWLSVGGAGRSQS